MSLEILLILINTLLSYGQEFCDKQYEDNLLNSVFNVENNAILGCRRQDEQQLCWRFVWTHNNKLIPKNSNAPIDFTGFEDIKCGFNIKQLDTSNYYWSLIENMIVVFSEKNFWIMKSNNETSYYKVNAINLYNEGFRIIFDGKPKHEYFNDIQLVFGKQQSLSVHAIAMKMMKRPQLYAFIQRTNFGPQILYANINSTSTYAKWTDFKMLYHIEFDMLFGAFYDLVNNIHVLYDNNIYRLTNDSENVFDNKNIEAGIGEPNSMYFPCPVMYTRNTTTTSTTVKPTQSNTKSFYTQIIIIMIAVILLLAVLIGIGLIILDIKSKRKERMNNETDKTISRVSTSSTSTSISGISEDSIQNITESETDR